MPQWAYSNPKRESDPYALPDLDIWRGILWTCGKCGSTEVSYTTKAAVLHNCCGFTMDRAEGWFWESCTPGCLPDSEPFGPFNTEAEALEDAREGMED